MKSAHLTQPMLSQADQPLTLLGGLTPQQFLQDYWHKKPLLIRQAIPDFVGLLSPNELAGLACEEDVQSRLVLQRGQQWHLEQGPFAESRFAKLPERDWTLLVQSVNHHLPSAQALLRQFNFLPYARLDDLMVSYAPDGGGVGPHFDSYDVFLLQGMGHRLWRISEQEDLSLVEGAPLRILQHFDTTQEWLLAPGDMLYLPPHLAHWGIAQGECMTYSIGFRAPSNQELLQALLGFIQQQLSAEGRYADADLRFSAEPAAISNDMVEKVMRLAQQIQIQADLVAEFLASYLSEPKAHIVLDLPRKLSFSQFQQRALQHGLMLSAKSILLYHHDHFYLNGERLNVATNSLPLLRELANLQVLHNTRLSLIKDENDWQILYQICIDGGLVFAKQ